MARNKYSLIIDLKVIRRRPQHISHGFSDVMTDCHSGDLLLNGAEGRNLTPELSPIVCML